MSVKAAPKNDQSNSFTKAVEAASTAPAVGTTTQLPSNDRGIAQNDATDAEKAADAEKARLAAVEAKRLADEAAKLKAKADADAKADAAILAFRAKRARNNAILSENRGVSVDDWRDADAGEYGAIKDKSSVVSAARGMEKRQLSGVRARDITADDYELAKESDLFEQSQGAAIVNVFGPTTVSVSASKDVKFTKELVVSLVLQARKDHKIS